MDYLQGLNVNNTNPEFEIDDDDSSTAIDDFNIYDDLDSEDCPYDE